MYIDRYEGSHAGDGTADPSQSWGFPDRLASPAPGKDAEPNASPEEKRPLTRSAGAGLPENPISLQLSREPPESAGEGQGEEFPEGDPSPNQASGAPEVYTRAETEAIAGHIQRYFGKIQSVFHEPSPGIHLDICMVPPSGERDYCTLVTLGMGARRMNPPAALAEYHLDRAELAISLSREWKRTPWKCRDDRWCWPVDLLKALALLSAGGAWLGRGCTVDNQKPFAANTWLRAALLTEPFCAAPGGAVCNLPGGESVHFYQVLPLYRNELKYGLEHGPDALIEKMKSIGFVTRPDRPDAITKGILRSPEEAADDILEMDNGLWHLTTLRMKKLPVDEANAFSHMTIYLRWAMERGLMGAAFLEDYGRMVEQIKADPGSVDLRGFLRDQLHGQLLSVLFNRTGRAFASYYYGYSEAPPHYPSDIDSYAISVIGQERNYSDEIQDEAYLFLPFNEDYYQAMARVIDRRFKGWQRQAFDAATLEPSPLAQALGAYLGCECSYFPSMRDDDPISAAWSYAQRDSAHQGFVPVVVRADDEALWRCLMKHSDPDSEGADGYAFDPGRVAAYRNRMLAAPGPDGREILEKMAARCKTEAMDGGMEGEKEIPGPREGGCRSHRFASYWKDNAGMTHPVILAKIPVRNPWEIFAYLPFGSRNDCPDTPELMAAAKYWFEQYGAAPAAISHDTLEFLLPAPVSGEKAKKAAAELYSFCPNAADQGPEGAAVGSLADRLRQSTVWHLWWA